MKPNDDITRLHRRIAELSDDLGDRTRERDEARAELDRLYGSYNGVCLERDEAGAEVVRLGKENEEHRRTIRSWQAAREADEAEVDAWLKRVNDGILTALADGLTDDQVEERIEKIKQTAAERIEARRLRAALDEERIEPDRCANCVRGCLPGPCPAIDLERFDSGAYTTPAEGRAEPEHPRCAAISSTGFRCLLLRGPHAVHEASNRSGGSVSWPAGRTEGEAG